MGEERMKYFAILISWLLLFGATASAQQVEGAGADSTASAEPAPAEAAPKEEEKKSIYKKKVGSLLWLEGLAGPSSFDPDKFGGLDLGAGTSDAPKTKGPEYGASLGVGLGGFVIGAFFRQANYDDQSGNNNDYKLKKIGLEMQGVFRFIPWVHPMIRIDLFYATTKGDAFPGVTNTDTNGGGFTLGAGLRIPVIKWISIAITFDWSMIGLGVKGESNSVAVSSGVLGQQLGATFALTFHFIQKRKQ
jgi:hypothetical protein